MASKIEMNAWVILRKDKHMKLVQIKPKQREFIAKVQFLFDGAIGNYFGTSFEIVKGQLTKVEPTALLEKVAGSEDATGSEEPETPEDSMENGDKSHEKESASNRQESPPIDNRNLFDRDENQRLGRDDIEEMRARGARGQEIIGQLVNNSLTFKGKTEYSREKYVNRKKKKHFSLLIILKPSTRLLCEMYYSKGPNKLCGLRLDTLTQMLLHTNVRAGAKLMVVESALGMVLGAVMERMGGIGKLVHLFGGSAPQKPAYVGFDFPESFHENYYEYPLDRVKELFDDDDVENGEDKAVAKEEETTLERKKDGGVEEEEVASMDAAENVVESIATASSSTSAVNDKNDEEEEVEEEEESSASLSEPPKKRLKVKNFDDPKVQQKRRLRVDRQNVAKDIIREKQMDGLIFCSRYHPTPIVVKLLDFVAPSRPIAIFNQFREPLIDVYNRLKNSGKAVNLRLTESWMREYQVLPGRTHALMQMSGGGGFLLTGYVVDA